MKASELRIGNFIFGIYENNNDQMCEQVVRFLGYDPFENYFWVDGDIEIESYDRFEPIPLTEEWLVKFGGELNTTALFTTYGRNRYFRFGGRIIIHREDGWYDYGSNVKLEFVHKFQNFMFELTGEELELKEVKP